MRQALRVFLAAVTCGASWLTSCAPVRDPAVVAGAVEVAPSDLGNSLRAGDGPTPGQDRPPATRRAAVVLIVLDGVRWQEVFQGVDSSLAGGSRVPLLPPAQLLPNLYRALATRGAAVGAPGRGGSIAASGPNFVSLPGYTEIFGGHVPDECSDNDCRGATSPTIADEFRHHAESDADVAVFASWERIARAAARDPDRMVVSTGRKITFGDPFLRQDPATRDWLDRGVRADAYPGYDDFRPDRLTAGLAIRYLESRRPSFLFVGLGEADEYAHRSDYAGYIRALRASDAVLGELFSTLDHMGDRGRETLVVVTSDHGRANNYRDHGGFAPESARVWLAALGGPVRARGLADAPRPYRLFDIAPTIRFLSDNGREEGGEVRWSGQTLAALMSAGPAAPDGAGAVTDEAEHTALAAIGPR